MRIQQWSVAQENMYTVYIYIYVYMCIYICIIMYILTNYKPKYYNVYPKFKIS
jgi:hypothetical protein